MDRPIHKQKVNTLETGPLHVIQARDPLFVGGGACLLDVSGGVRAEGLLNGGPFLHRPIINTELVGLFGFSRVRDGYVHFCPRHLQR